MEAELASLNQDWPDADGSTFPTPPADVPPWRAGETAPECPPNPAETARADARFLSEQRALYGDDNWGAPVYASAGNAQDGDVGPPDYGNNAVASCSVFPLYNEEDEDPPPDVGSSPSL